MTAAPSSVAAAGAMMPASVAAALRGLARGLGSLLLIALALWLVQPRLSATQYLAGGASGPVRMPWVFNEVSRGNRLDVQLRAGWLTPRRWNIVPDDHLRELRINGQAVPLDGVPAGGLEDYERGFTLDLSPWLRHGDNTLQFVLDNNGGVGGLTLRPRLGWRWLLLGAGFVPWLLTLARLFRLRRGQTLVLIAALAVLCAYWAATPWTTRQHDAGGDSGHIAYIDYIATRLALPPPNGGWTYFHPPLYYLGGALVWSGAHGLGLPAMESLQALSLALWLVFLAASAGCLKLALRRSPAVLVLATAALALWPSGIIHGLRISNDALLYAATAAASWYLLRWWRSGRRRHLLAASLLTAVALLAKSNAIAVAAALALLLLLRLLRRWRAPRRWADAALAGAVVGSGLLLSLASRLYYYWRGEIPHWLIANSDGLSSGLRVPLQLRYFLPLDVPVFLTQPWIAPYDEATGRSNFWNYLLRSALSGEFRFDGPMHRFIAYAWGALLLCLLLLLLRAARWPRLAQWRDLPLLALGLLWLASLLTLRIQTPYACSNDFRYVLPILLPFIVGCARAGLAARSLLLVLVLGSVPFFVSL